MPIIGLTGNFGMGKSTVLKLFRESGVFTYSADDFVHKILENQAIIRRIVRVLGKEVLTSRAPNLSLDKNKIAGIIFDDQLKRKAIEKIVHPEVLKAIKLTASDILSREPSASIIFEVPLLFEAGYEHFFDKTIVVYCKQSAALERLVQKGFTKKAALKRIRAQMPITQKKRLAHFLINNNDSIANTKAQVKKIIKKLA